MHEPMALFLASLSHRWAPVALSLPVVCGALTYASAVLLARSRSNPAVRVRRAALAIRALSFNLFALSLLVFGVSITHAGCASVKAHSVQCMSNLKAIAEGSVMYAQDYDERLPPADRWSPAIESHVAKSARADDFHTVTEPFHCPASASRFGYGMNKALDRKQEDSIGEPSVTVLFFDADAETSAFSGSATSLARERHEEVPNVAFADGHVTDVNSYRLHGLNWSLSGHAPTN